MAIAWLAGFLFGGAFWLKVAEWKWQNFRDAAESLLETLPRCVKCTRLATHAFRRGEDRWCWECAPSGCPAYPRHIAIKKLKTMLGRERNL